MASADADGFVHVWNAAAGTHEQTFRPDNGTVLSLGFDPQSARLAAAGWWRTEVWSLDRPSSPPLILGAPYGTTDVHFRPDGKVLATCIDGTGHVRLWDLVADARTDHWAGHASSVSGLAVARDAQWLVTSGANGIARWQRGQSTPAFSIDAGAPVNGLAASPSGRWLASVGHPTSAAVWDARDGRRVASLPGTGVSRAVAFSDDDRKIYVGEVDGTLSAWDWGDGGARGPHRTKSPDAEVLALTTGQGRVFVAHRNRVVTVRDGESGREIRKLQPASAAFSLALSPDGRLLAAGTWVGTVSIWDIETGRQVKELKGQARAVAGLDFSHDGRLLASASRGGPIWLWEVATGQWIATVPARQAGAERVRFLADGARLAIGYQDGEVEIRNLTYFFRHAAGHAPYQLEQFREAGETFPRADEVLAWSRRILSGPVSAPVASARP